MSKKGYYRENNLPKKNNSDRTFNFATKDGGEKGGCNTKNLSRGAVISCYNIFTGDEKKGATHFYDSRWDGWLLYRSVRKKFIIMIIINT